jgi:hypothetical protein
MAQAGEGWVPQSADPGVEAERIQFEIYRGWTAARKLETMESLRRAARELSLAGLRLRHPRASEEELFLREAALRLGPELAARVYGRRFTELAR